jgi:hypothetical protein
MFSWPRFPSLIGLIAVAALTTRSYGNTLYVDLNSTNPIPPFSSWATAATNIQDAVDASLNGDVVLVTNGIYGSGGRKWFDSGTNRVTLTNSVTLQSVNGPLVTWIVGNRIAGAGSALTNAARCVYMGNAAVLSGFTLTNGEAGTDNYPNGGAVVGGTVTNCVLVGNLATNSWGGGAFRSTLIDCQVTGNAASSGGGSCACTLIRCTVLSNTAAFGGGVNSTTVSGPSFVTNCIFSGNSASGAGGAAYGGTLTGCSISNNRAGAGGGAWGSGLNNCLLVANSATNGGGAYNGTLNNSLVISNMAGSGGGIYGASVTNCTVVSNIATNEGGGVSIAYCQNSILYYNDTGGNHYGSTFLCCCTVPPNLAGLDLTTVTNEPLFVNLADGDFHLQSTSPCINSGNNRSASGSPDLDGQPRIAGGTVDIGCYEYPTPASVISYAWLGRYGLSTDGSADFADPDQDGLSTWQEWIAGTSPTNALSVLAMKQIVPMGNGGGVSVTWQCVPTRTYYVQRSTDLAQPNSFSSIKSNLPGQTATMTFVDQTATNTGPYFYRVGIQ